MHKCTCKAHHQSPTSEEQDTFIEYREEDQFSDMGDGTIQDQDEDGATDSDWDEHATLIALLDDVYVKHASTLQSLEISWFTHLNLGWRDPISTIEKLSSIDSSQHSLLTDALRKSSSRISSFQ